MENNNQHDSFSYTYSAKQQDEVKRIRQKYQPQEEDKMERLRKLDASVSKKASTVSIILGVIGTLIMGSGMSFAMVGPTAWFIPGIIIGVVGIAVIALAYPTYTHITKKERERIAPEILRLTDELMK